MRAMVDLTDQTFGRLTVLEPTRRPRANGWAVVYWLCRCACGVERVVRSDQLRYGRTRSCGCLRNELTGLRGRARFTRHGRYGSPEHASWRGMLQRCLRVNHPGWRDYGARGITVCERWRSSFQSFYLDMGARPSGMTLDRIDVDGQYTASNCRWATWAEQVHNQRRRSPAA